MRAAVPSAPRRRRKSGQGRYRAGLMDTELSRLDATAQAELVRRGDASPAELVDAAIARVEKLNGELNAVIHPLFDRARSRRERRAARTGRSAASRSS